MAPLQVSSSAVTACFMRPHLMGEPGYGSVFRFDTAGNVTLLHQFNNTDGADPSAPMTLGSDGAMYGVTSLWRRLRQGTVYRIEPDGTFTSLFSLSLTDGYVPHNALVLAKNGVLYAPTRPAGRWRALSAWTPPLEQSTPLLCRLASRRRARWCKPKTVGSTVWPTSGTRGPQFGHRDLPHHRIARLLPARAAARARAGLLLPALWWMRRRLLEAGS